MTSEMDVLERLKETIEQNLSSLATTQPVIGRDNVSIDYPDLDSMRRETMVYIQPDYAGYSELTTSSDEARLETEVFIVCKGASRDVLVKRVFSYFSAFLQMLKSDNTLNGKVDSTRITDMDYYPYLTSSGTMVAIKAKVELVWEMRFATTRR